MRSRDIEEVQLVLRLSGLLEARSRVVKAEEIWDQETDE